jgi:hypothetical protein
VSLFFKRRQAVAVVESPATTANRVAALHPDEYLTFDLLRGDDDDERTFEIKARKGASLKEAFLHWLDQPL